MFAVPGWSLSAASLKPETSTSPPKAVAPAPGVSGPSTKGTGANATQLFAPPPAKKRKRDANGDASGSGPKVTADNLADMWERVIEKKDPPAPAKKDKKNKRDKKQKPNSDKHESKKQKQQPTSAPDQATADFAASDSKPTKGAGATTKATPKTTTPAPVPEAPSGQPDGAKTKDKKGKKDKKDKEKKEDTAQQDKGQQKDVANAAAAAKPGKPGQKDGKAKAQAHAPAHTTPSAAVPAAAALALALPPPPPKLTPLQASMRAKLVSARFRHLNETLYTSPSDEALRLFGESPDMFHAYHEGFRQQVAVWPENPVDGYVDEVRRRAGRGTGGRGDGGRGGRGGRGSRGGRGGRGGPFRGPPRDPTDTLPRTRGLCRLADIGCGDARLAATLMPEADRLRIEVLSYDLHADPSNPFITAAADAADLPLAAGTVDVAVFCLALMGTNWLAFVEEAYRVLRWKGELWVAEIKSRFAGSAELRVRLRQKLNQQKGPVAHSVGFRKKAAARKKATGPDDDDDPDAIAAATAEVDGHADGPNATGGATDVSAFVRALRRRGFVLDEGAAAADNDADDDTRVPSRSKPPAVDLSNRMFVRMRFVKAAPPAVGKDEVMAALDAMNGGAGAHGKKKKLKFLDDDGGDQNADPVDDPALEAKILKPCVYKLR